MYNIWKFILDKVFSICLIIIFLPFFLIIAILIKRTSPGPIMFKQIRIGKNGLPFIYLKFRTMYTETDSTMHDQYVKNFILSSSQDSNNIEALRQEAFSKLSSDPRITPIGRFLRNTSLDELPQVFNVLKGDMSIVGPRPSLPYEVEHYDEWHKDRLKVKPGIIGLWQIKGRSRTTFDEMVRLDMEYINKKSILLDLKILLRTPWAIIRFSAAR